jgi:hypothetical protein
LCDGSLWNAPQTPGENLALDFLMEQENSRTSELDNRFSNELNDECYLLAYAVPSKEVRRGRKIKLAAAWGVGLLLVCGGVIVKTSRQAPSRQAIQTAPIVEPEEKPPVSGASDEELERLRTRNKRLEALVDVLRERSRSAPTNSPQSVAGEPPQPR